MTEEPLLNSWGLPGGDLALPNPITHQPVAVLRFSIYCPHVLDAVEENLGVEQEVLG